MEGKKEWALSSQRKDTISLPQLLFHFSCFWCYFTQWFLCLTFPSLSDQRLCKIFTVNLWMSCKHIFSILIRRWFFITSTAAGMAAGRIIVWTPPRQQWLNSGCSRGTSWFFCTELTVYLEPGALTGTAHMVFSLSLRPPYPRAVTREEIKRNQMLKSLLWQRLLENPIKWSCSGIPYRHSYYDQYQGVQSHGCTAVRNK